MRDRYPFVGKQELIFEEQIEWGNNREEDVLSSCCMRQKIKIDSVPFPNVVCPFQDLDARLLLRTREYNIPRISILPDKVKNYLKNSCAVVGTGE